MKKRLLLLIIPLILIIGASYAFFRYYEEGNNHVVIGGNLYLNMSNNQAVNMSGMYPMTDEDGIENGVKYNFSVSGYNTTDKKIDYGVYVIDGDEIPGKTKLRYTDIKVYLEETVNGEKTGFYGPVNLANFNENLIYANTISSNVTKENQIKIDYTLTMWIDENVLISDTETEVFGKSVYTSEEFKNSYTSLKVQVEGLTSDISLPLTIESSDSFVENNKAYFIAKISNYNSDNEIGTNSNDNIRLEVIGDNPNVTFSYKDSEGNDVEEAGASLDLNYVFNKKKAIEVQIFYSLESEDNELTNINLRLTKNGELLQNVVKRIAIFGSNFCLVNGFNKLYDCILASDSLTTNIETAKVNIANKGEVNLNDTAPSYTYVEEETLDVTNAYSYTGYKFYFSDSYEFDATTGKFLLVNKDGSNAIEDILSDNYKNYYTCGATIEHNPCGTIYRVKETSVDGTKYTITLGDKITYKIASSIRSEVGLYKSEDDYGDAYFYRGDVSNNNVYFGGYYWKIIRTNGDNSIRLIYNGETSNATSYKTSINNTSYTYSVAMPEAGSMYLARHADPTYVGYMYGKNFARQTSSGVRYQNIVALTKYYFADDFEFDSEKEIFRIKKKELDPVAKTFSEMNATDSETGKKLYELYPYTCRTTTETGTCDVLLEVKSIVHETAAEVIYHSYSSVDKDGTRTNEYSSNVKIKLEEWYEKNIVNKTDEAGNLITDYIVDGTFCNDRSTPYPTYSSGYLLNKLTYYGAYTRLSDPTLAVNKTATLKCSVDENGTPDTRDWFSHTPNKGNGKLNYPIGLITADEVAFAGGKHSTSNENYYLRANYNYWTMSPGNYSSNYSYVHIMIVSPAGALGYYFCTGTIGVRAVINIRSDVLISSGDGTIEKPFILSLS